MRSFSALRMALLEVNCIDFLTLSPLYLATYVSIAGRDYVGVSKTLVFAFGFRVSQCVHIPILTDDCLEETESFNVSLSSPQDCVEINVAEISVYIIEDDGKWMERECYTV